MEARYHTMDWLRALAILFVLVIHSVLAYTNTDNESLIAGWFSTVTRPTIAMFLFVSGYFFSEHPTTPYMLTRYKRVLIPYLLFSGLAILYQQRLIGVFSYLISDWEIVLGNLLIGYTWGVYWFIPLIIFVYTLAFLIFYWGWKPDLLQLTLIFLGVNLLHGAYYQPFIQFLRIEEHPIIWVYSYRFFISWPFYFFLGMLFRRYRAEPLVTSYTWTVILSWLGVFIVVNLLYFTQAGLIDMYNSIIGTIYSVATIFLVLLINTENATITLLSKLSYLIYLAHYFFIVGLQAIEKISGIVWPFWFWPISFIISLVGPILLYLVVKRILGEKSTLLIGA